MTLARFLDKVGHCAIESLDGWRRANRIPLYPRKLNRWILVRAPIGSPSLESLASEASEVMLGWFGDPWGDNELPRGRISLPVIDYVGADRPDTSAYPPLTAWRSDLPNPPILAMPGSEPFYVVVSFGYYGSGTSAPWPVSALMHETPLFSLPYAFQWECPYGPMWTVQGVFEPGPEVVVPQDANSGFWIPGKGAYQNPAEVIGERAKELKRQFDRGLSGVGGELAKETRKAVTTFATATGLSLGVLALYGIYKVTR